ncbi:hypothetical protein A2673_00925 [Candidatus Kaiserbacteria bacterium RIFCSPHIGHO2_01_FULL_50_13]|uniref:Uncharacterized protein n=1 Tax=Candidatus Kaiserbacteria bacterium RIFCSPLOWO2_01_FULL_50_24 TaxID=1798507 RepID=A0A1F6EMV3_9BACT|nr:MAG: hypothetical protein A2673_00925 [Candidatus Kaiserbacteria bacterium RIFCSPHIGHO2_01_FULL_50_13]OGG74960.1 MAG: hypothetical protein A3A34_04045 [Candidatus Kaiserbacteria bacterium RIFCSPLOWO2_01_FULL_50_24]OGG81762.1 MAG: hypothetical protein A3H74_01120 [Candidatus Kaiserbacteria bacterium RIFCSPLOWO2_02_FULL_51_13]
MEEFDMVCPYSELDLMIARLGMDFGQEKYSEEKFEKVNKEIHAVFPMPNDTATVNKHIAAENGISVEALLNSPNYSILVSDLKKRIVLATIQKLRDEFELDDKEAWALLLTISKQLG